MAPKQRNSAGLKRLIAFWSRYCTLDSFHVQWIHRRAEIIRVRRGDVLCYQGELQRNLFFVLEGVLAKTTTRQHLGRERRRILRIALPNAGLSTTAHLYSHTASNGNIVALRSGTVLRLPYKAVLELKLAEPAIGTLEIRKGGGLKILYFSNNTLFLCGKASSYKPKSYLGTH